MSRFLIVVVVSVVLAACGFFIRMNVVAERLEPEAMQRAQQEDSEVDPEIASATSPVVGGPGWNA